MHIGNLFKRVTEEILYRADIVAYHCSNLRRGTPARIMTGIALVNITGAVIINDLATIVGAGVTSTIALYGAWAVGSIESEPEDYPRNKPRWRHLGHCRI